MAENAAQPIQNTGRVAKNASIYLVSQIITWLVTFVSVSYIPRHIGARGSGEMWLAYGTLLTMLAFFQLGIDPFLAKEIGRDNRQTERLLGATIALRLLLIPLVVVATLLTLSTLNPSRSIWLLTMVYLLGMPFGFIATSFRAALVGREEARRVAILDILNATGPLYAIPFLFYGPIALAWTTVGAQFLFLILSWRWVLRNQPLRPLWDRTLWQRVLRDSMPFWINSFILQFYTYTTQWLLNRFADVATVGVYGQAWRLFGTFLFVPTALGTALLPSLARMADYAPQEFRRVQSRVFCLLIILGLPVMVSVMLLAKPLSVLLYGPNQFVTMPETLQVYALALLPMYIVSIMYQFLVAQNRNALWTYFIGASVGVCALLCTLLIPLTIRLFQNGAIGAILSIVITETLSAVCAFALLRTNPFTTETTGRIIRALLAAAGMAGILWGMRLLAAQAPLSMQQNGFFLFPYLIVSSLLGLATFVVLAWLLRALAPEDQEKFVGLVRRKLRRGA
jgi:O-antigen/teichoic acid export membrane protein